MLALVCRGFVFGLKGLTMYFGTGTQVLLGVCEEVVGAGADEVGTADFLVGNRELSVPGGGTGAHELLCGEACQLRL